VTEEERVDAIAAMFSLCTESQIIAALEWVENDMPLYYGEEGVRDSWNDPETGDP